jgi:hypothetical protein
MGTSVRQIDVTYGHLVPDSEEYLLGLLDSFDRTPMREPTLFDDYNGGLLGLNPAVARYATRTKRETGAP